MATKILPEAFMRASAVDLARSIAAASEKCEALLDDLPYVTMATANDAETRSELQVTLIGMTHAIEILDGIVKRETDRYDRMGRPEAA